MRYKFLTNSQAAWAAMFEAMANAFDCIYLEMYIFAEGTEFNFLELLKEKAKIGIKVKIILDSFGSRELSKEAADDLTKSGAELIFFSSFFHKTHRKIVAVDGKVAFIGGVNLHPSTRRWNDLVVRIEGNMVAHIVRSFAKSYALCGGKDEALLLLNNKVALARARMWIFEHFPVSNKYNLKRIYQEALRKADKDFTFVTPYFVPRRWLIAAMHQAVLRGVKVEVLMPAKTDHYIVDRMNYFYMTKLSKLGIAFYIAPKMNHGKAMVIDQKTAVVGTQNLDPISFEFNSEIGVFIEDPETVQKLLEITDQWKKESIAFDPETYNRKWIDYLLWPILRVLFFL